MFLNSSPHSRAALRNKYFIVFEVFSTADIPQPVCQSAGVNNLLMFFHFKRLHETLKGVHLSYLLLGGCNTTVQRKALTISMASQEKFSSIGQIKKKKHIYYAVIHTLK